jgi:hypothetical protein
VFWGNDEIHDLWWEWAYIPLSLLQAVALFGFVYFRPIVSASFWKAVFVVAATYEIWNGYDMVTNWVPLATPLVATFVLVLVYSVQIPLWYGNFLYGFRCVELWDEKT